jgi:hypothetical protein
MKKSHASFTKEMLFKRATNKTHHLFSAPQTISQTFNGSN